MRTWRCSSSGHIDPEVYRMLEKLRATHADDRLLQIVDLIESTAMRGRLTEEMNELLAQLRQISLPAKEADQLWSGYGEALSGLRLDHITQYLLQKGKISGRVRWRDKSRRQPLWRQCTACVFSTQHKHLQHGA